MSDIKILQICVVCEVCEVCEGGAMRDSLMLQNMCTMASMRSK